MADQDAAKEYELGVASLGEAINHTAFREDASSLIPLTEIAIHALSAEPPNLGLAEDPSDDARDDLRAYLDKELKQAQDEFSERTGGGVSGAKWVALLLPKDFQPPVDLRWPEFVQTARGEEWWIPTPATGSGAGEPV